MHSGTQITQGLRLAMGDSPAWTVEAVRQARYHVVSSDHLFTRDNTTLLTGCPDAPLRSGERRLLVVDENVDTLYGAQIREFFDFHDIRATVLTLRADETVKQWDAVCEVVDAMNDFGIDRRREPVMAIGGGVLTDIVGFAASIYRRGTPYIRIPTTLIGLVDAGVGVKTGVNYSTGKNRLGTYAPATATFLDRSFLRSLDLRHISNGLAEILKMALIRSEKLFDLLESHGPAVRADRFQGTNGDLARAADAIIAESIHLMLEELQPNLWESSLERCVDYGHTFSPTVEMHALPELLHGEAVVIDMALTTALSTLRGDVSEAQADRIFSVIRALGLPLWNAVLDDTSLLEHALQDTVRHRDGQQRLPLPLGIGRHRFVNDVTPAELREAARLLHGRAADLSPAASDEELVSV
ncbi:MULTISPECIES: sedoheptulose 7-phosphate cyclase [Streptomyces]|uniref:2-epi-5-epi-valiolone synthase n=1 Tax=Streptomyces sviceus (strain ATCC 29083 / DSM 924 / JCM 4929 / NBRC 13980 / NCIMB 11184 / NRRL 5439 / UC 5370) TaxID=463191 RepID=B5HR69_STRX2|nr:MULTISPECIES: sedoheptulose 7-phosphate cyclase [Streptomyces]EDY55324.2 3-dehydroquinate synthase [Streptomyces sviceus ATCC 29083]MYT09208.1 iron-containing alcohol dehydrogenase [Streptomyces sp. SID5470]